MVREGTVTVVPQKNNKKGEIDMSTTIGGLSNSTVNSIRGYGGLASGLDRDTLIESMTYGTTSKITAQQKKKTQLEWKQSAVQSITNLMVSFANKYTSSFSSSANLFSSVFWGRSNLTTTGTNSKYVSVSGSAKSADAVTIMGVKQLAKKAVWTSDARTEGTSNALTTGEIDTTKPQFRKELVGESLTFKVGDSNSYTIFLNTTDSKGNELKYDTVDNAIASINTLLKEETAGEGKLFDHFEIDKVTEGGVEQFVFKGKGGDHNAVTGGTALEYLGFEKPEGGEIVATSEGAKGKNGTGKITTPINFAQQIGGKTLNFTYNGVSKDIKIADADTLSEGVTFENGKPKTEDDQKKLIENLQKSLQDGFDSAFGKGRIDVGLSTDGKKLSFQTINVSKSTDTKKVVDTTATLTLNSGSYGLLGEEGALNVKSGSTNKLDRNSTLEKSGLLNGLKDSDFEEVKEKDADGKEITRYKASITINGEKVAVYKDDTVNSLMDRINKNERVGVEVSYQAATDKFTFTSTENGASGVIKFGAADDTVGNTLLKNIFGAEETKAGEEVRGQDAIVTVKYAGSDEEVDLYRDANTFTVDGLTISVKSEFGYNKVAKKDADGKEMKDADGKTIWDTDKDGNIKWEKDKETFDPVEINASVNTDSIVDSIKSMVEEYNAIIELVNKEVSTKPDRDYSPLTSEQKKELSEDEIKLYEEKAKQGLLFNDSDLRMLSTDLCFVISGGNIQALADIGISTSSTYSDNGKLVLDESKLRAALQSDPEKVEKLFTGTAATDANGKAISHDGLATNLKKVMDKYVETLGSWETKGILIRKAGSESSPLSITENYMYKEIAEINKQIAKFQEKLKSEQDRYIKQFTSLETLISQMNSQSNWLAQIGGSY